MALHYQGLAPYGPGIKGEAEDKIRALEKKINPSFQKDPQGLGWYAYPDQLKDRDLEDLVAWAKKTNKRGGKTFILGIGGSYHGAKAGLSALCGKDLPLVFSGHSLSSRELAMDLALFDPKKDHVLVISKSGTTAEISLSLRWYRDRILRVLGKVPPEAISVITDEDSPLMAQAQAYGHQAFSLPKTMGGRFSVLSPVGLLPMALGGVDVFALLEGARAQKRDLDQVGGLENPANAYAWDRYQLYSQGKQAELFCVYEACLEELGRWYAQLFGESEGKNGRGLFPTSLLFTRDLHSLGQYIQEGPRNFFETTLYIKEPEEDLLLPPSSHKDGLEGLEGLSLNDLGQIAREGTQRAHKNGGVPLLNISLDRLDAHHLGAFFYFMQRACAMSAYLLGVNPFNQTGVDVYKEEIRQEMEKIRGKNPSPF
ncbi:MAG: glucose-6-phosphate isomerase [Tissierellia bacterium]|nr:glucose-6-phosphate isomerase [Tissierellia bacterium]